MLSVLVNVGTAVIDGLIAEGVGKAKRQQAY